MTSWLAVAGQLTMPGSSINDKSGISLGILSNTKQTGITLRPHNFKNINGTLAQIANA